MGTTRMSFWVIGSTVPTIPVISSPARLNALPYALVPFTVTSAACTPSVISSQEESVAMVPAIIQLAIFLRKLTALTAPTTTPMNYFYS